MEYYLKFTICSNSTCHPDKEQYSSYPCQIIWKFNCNDKTNLVKKIAYRDLSQDY